MKNYRVCVNEINYGFVDVAVADDATEEEIYEAAQNAYDRGGFYSSNSELDFGEITEN